MNFKRILPTKRKALFFSIFILLVLVSGTIIAQVSNQLLAERVSVSSPSGLKQKPERLAKPKINPLDSTPFQTIPDDIAFGQVFRHIEELNRKANEEEQIKGKDGKQLRTLYKEMAKLNERQSLVLDQVAYKVNQELKKLDIQAKQIIENIRSRTPNGRLEKGQPPPIPPPQLIELNTQRKNVILQAVAELKNNLGEEDFVKFTRFVDQNIKPNIKKRMNKLGGAK